MEQVSAVDEVNDNHVVPEAVNVSSTVLSGDSVIIQLVADDPNETAITYLLGAGPSNGILDSFDEVTGMVTYTPNAEFVGTDSFEFSATDGEYTSNVATVNIEIKQPLVMMVK